MHFISLKKFNNSFYFRTEINPEHHFGPQHQQQPQQQQQPPQQQQQHLQQQPPPSSIHHISDREVEKDLFSTSYCRTSQIRIQGPEEGIIQPKAEYLCAQPGDTEQKGRARLDNWIIEDRISNKELQDLLWIFKNSEGLLFSPNLTALEEVFKKRLLALLISINWSLQIPSQQIKFMKQMEERLFFLKGNKV